MKIKSLRIHSLYFILFSIACFQLNANASLNPLKWFSNNESTSKVIELNNNYEKESQGLVKKLTNKPKKNLFVDLTIDTKYKPTSCISSATLVNYLLSQLSQ